MKSYLDDYIYLIIFRICKSKKLVKSYVSMIFSYAKKYDVFMISFYTNFIFPNKVVLEPN